MTTKCKLSNHTTKGGYKLIELYYYNQGEKVRLDTDIMPMACGSSPTVLSGWRLRSHHPEGPDQGPSGLEAERKEHYPVPV